MNFLYLIIGIVIGILLSILNILAYKREVQTKLKNFRSKKVEFINPNNPVDDIDLS
jgi:MFS superfamily sulfate permease-like transporter